MNPRTLDPAPQDDLDCHRLDSIISFQHHLAQSTDHIHKPVVSRVFDEVLVGHMETDRPPRRNSLKGSAGDVMHLVLYAAGQSPLLMAIVDRIVHCPFRSARSQSIREITIRAFYGHLLHASQEAELS